jgi:hypothetical protein
MKKMLITASAVGAAIAGLILYARSRNENGKLLPGSKAKDAFNARNDGLGKIERNALHSMG